jgi:hypothetical protein
VCLNGLCGLKLGVCPANRFACDLCEPLSGIAVALCLKDPALGSAPGKTDLPSVAETRYVGEDLCYLRRVIGEVAVGIARGSSDRSSSRRRRSVLDTHEKLSTGCNATSLSRCAFFRGAALPECTTGARTVRGGGARAPIVQGGYRTRR